MTSWYYACCDAHRETCTIFIVNNNGIAAAYPADATEAAQAFLVEHWTCKLRLLSDHEDDVASHGYVDKTPP